MAADAKLQWATGAITSTTTGSTIDLVNGTPKEGLCLRYIVTAVTGTSPTDNPKIQHSDDGSTWYDLAMSNPLQFTAAGQGEIRFNTPKRYVRLVETLGGTSPNFTRTAEIVFGTAIVE